MSIANENNRVELTATAAQATFAYNFRIDATDEIAVYLTPTGVDPDDATQLLTLTTDYTLTGIGEDGGGNIVLTSGSYPSGATAGDVVVAVRDIGFDQDTVFETGQDSAVNQEQSADRLAMRVQRLEEIISRALKSQVTDGSELLLPVAAEGKVLEWQSGVLVNANKLTGSGVASDATDVSIADAAGNFTSGDVEGALAETATRDGTETLTNKTIDDLVLTGTLNKNSVPVLSTVLLDDPQLILSYSGTTTVDWTKLDLSTLGGSAEAAATLGAKQAILHIVVSVTTSASTSAGNVLVQTFVASDTTLTGTPSGNVHKKTVCNATLQATSTSQAKTLSTAEEVNVGLDSNSDFQYGITVNSTVVTCASQSTQIFLVGYRL